MADYTKNLIVRLTGDSKSAQQAFAELEAASSKSAKLTADLAVKNVEGWKQFEEQLKKANAAVEQIGQSSPGMLSKLSSALNQNFSASHPTTGALLDAAGISESAAVVAGGVAVAGAAVVKFGADSVQSFARATDAVRQFQAVSGATAEQASVFVNAANLMGVSSESLSMAIGRQAVNIEKNAKTLHDYGIEAVRTSNGNVDQVATFERVVKVLQSTTDSSERATIAQAVYGRSWQGIAQMLGLTAEQMQKVIDLAKKGPVFSQEDENRALAMKESTRALGQEWEKIKDKVGLVLAPLVTAFAKIENEILTIGEGIGSVWLRAIEKVAQVGEHLPTALGGHLFRDLAGAAGSAANSLDGFRTTAEDAGNQADQTSRKVLNLSSSLNTLSDYLKAGQADWQAFTDSQRAVTSVNDGYAKALDDLNTAQDKTAKSVSDSGQKIADAASRIGDAEQNLAEVAADSQQRIADVNEATAQRIVDAQQRVVDAQDAAADSAVKGEQRVSDAKQHLADTINSSLANSNPYAAQRSVDDARQALLRTESEVAKEQEKQAQNVGKAQDTLADTQKQAAKERAKAEQEASKQIASAAKQVESAQDAMTKATQAAGTATEVTGGQMRDAATKAEALVGATYDVGYQTALMGGSMDTVVPKIDAARAKVDELGNSGQLSWQRVAELHRQLDAIPNQINKSFVLHLDLSAFRKELQAASLNVQDPASRAAVALGAYDALPGGEVTPTLTRDAGGPLPPGLSRVYNNTGKTEWISTAEQQAAMAGGGDTYNINIGGSLLMEHDLAELLTNLRKKGVAGI